MTKYTNLWDETISKLSKYGKAFEDVEYIRGNDFEISKENFEKIARKTEYYAGYGSAKVAGDLKLIGVDDFTQDELTKIISQFNNGNLMKIRNFFVNPKNINCFVVDDFEESMEDL